MTTLDEVKRVGTGDIDRLLRGLPVSLPEDADSYVVLPGFCDVHVHFREPGFSYKETIRTGTLAAARGGYTAVCTMPNLSPAPDCAENFAVQKKIVDETAVIPVYPYGTITKGEKGEELSDMEGMPEAIAFSDDGRGVQTAETMERAMREAKRLGKMIVAHCEVNELLRGGYIHDGVYAKTHGHRGICSESEYAQIERDLALARKTGCAYHVCHVSTKESVVLIRNAKKEGLNVSCETAPHYLVLDENDLREDGFFKMNPPLRSREDRYALLEGITDGTIEMIATDHAPHAAEEKNKGLEKSAFGVVGLETAFPVLYTELVRTGIIPLTKLVELLAIAPRKRFGIPFAEDFSVWDIKKKYTVDGKDFLSMGKASPFLGREAYGTNVLTVANGKAVYKNEKILGDAL